MQKNAFMPIKTISCTLRFGSTHHIPSHDLLTRTQYFDPFHARPYFTFVYSVWNVKYKCSYAHAPMY